MPDEERAPDSADDTRTWQQLHDELELSEQFRSMFQQRVELIAMLSCQGCVVLLQLCEDNHPIIHMRTCHEHADSNVVQALDSYYKAVESNQEATLTEFLNELAQLPETDEKDN